MSRSIPVELRHLRNFWILAEELNFTRAARRAILSQSALSEQIARLEEVLDTRLFDRNRRSVQLTVAGRVLMENVSDLLDHVDLVIERTRKAGGTSRSTLRVGYSAMSLNSPMAGLLQAFNLQHPQTETFLKEQSSGGSEKELLHGTFDCIFTPNPPENPQLSYLTISHDPVLCCVRKDSPLAASPVVEIQDIKDTKIILPDHGSRYAAFLLAAFSAAGIEPRLTARCSRPSIFLTMVSTGQGIAFLPTSLRAMAPDSLTLVPFGSPPLSMPFALVWNRSRLTPETERLIEIAVTHMA